MTLGIFWLAETLRAADFYCWQRRWDAATIASCEQIWEDDKRNLAILASELISEKGIWKWQNAEVPKTWWQRNRVTAVLRLGVGVLQLSQEEISRIITQKAQQIGCKQIQLDLDIPESRISDYAPLLQTLRKANPEISWSVTLLPCHLKHQKAMKEISAQVAYYVLQLHGIEAPRLRSENYALMNEETTTQAIKQARELGAKFIMALPTYGYILKFDSNGRFERLYSEGFGTTDDYSLLELAAPNLPLIAQIIRDNPDLELIWFRLPVAGDRWNLAIETIEQLEKGCAPEAELELTQFPLNSGSGWRLEATFKHQIPLKPVTINLYNSLETPTMPGEFWPLNNTISAPDTAYGTLPTTITITPQTAHRAFPIGIILSPTPLPAIIIERVPES